MSRVVLVVVCCGSSLAQTDDGTIHGIVKSGNTPLPGVAVTAANTLTGQKVSTSTDLDGAFNLQVPANGRYVVRTQMIAFASKTVEVVINTGNRSARADFDLVLLSRAPAPEAQSRQVAAGAAGNGATRGYQSIAALEAEGGASAQGADQVVPQGMPVPGISPDAASESVAISGNTSPNDFAGLSSDEVRQRVQEYRDQQSGGRPGGLGGPPGGPPGGGPGGPMIFSGGRRGRFDFNRPHGMVFYSVDSASLDAAPYALNATPGVPDKPDYLQNQFGVSIGGPLVISKLIKSTRTFFFFNYTGSRAENPYDAFTNVPTPDMRAGNFNGLVYPSGPFKGQPVTIFQPGTATPFPGNLILAIDPSAAALLPYIPLPNMPAGSLLNFHYVTSAKNDVNNLNLRVMRSLGKGTAGPSFRGGPRNNLSVGFHYQTSDLTVTNPFPTVGGNTSTRSFDIPVGYVRTFGKLTNNFRVDFNRSRTETSNLYAFVTDVAANAQVSGVSQNPFDWGVPNLSFTNFASLRDTNPLLRRDQTFTISDSMAWNHGKHTLRWGGDFRRIQLNTQTDSNARGSFVFTGLNTSEIVGGQPVPGTGFDFADFLLGLPQQTSVQFGNNNYHFRANSWDLFVQDEWRLRGNLTLNLGLRYEYVSPFSEVGGQIVNLDIAPGFTAVAPVLPGQAGPYTGVFPAGLVAPDRNNFAPRLGIAWKPKPNTVVRAGYGINYNTSQYGAMVQQLAFQPPFSVTQTNTESTSPIPLTLANGFPTPPPATITNNYGVDRDYRLGYVQIWNLDIQQQLRPDLVLNIDYTGTKGTRLDIVEAPNRGANGPLIPGVQSFLWETSGGDSVAHAGTVRLRKRLRRGVSVGGSYTFSKSIDNASTIGGGQTVVAQDAFDLAAERGLSSFDQRHRFTADYIVELPFGHDKRWLTQKGAARALFGDWQWSGDWAIASGTPFTARVLGDIADVNRGTNGTLRADYNGQPISISDPTITQWFNVNAFTLPPQGQFGDAGRNTIIGPGAVVFDMAFTKLIPFSDTKTLELRAQASNIFNTPQFTSIDTVVNSPTFGRVVSVGAMRRFRLQARFRF